MSRRVRSLLPVRVANYLAQIRQLMHAAYYVGGRHKRECPLCGYKGYFYATGVPMRFDAICKNCGSAERHRQHHLLVERNASWIDGAKVLHFGAERCFKTLYKDRTAHYIMADIDPSYGEVYQDIQKMEFEDNTFDTVICHQILEHVDDDNAAINEMHRVLKPNGRAIISVPIIPKWDDSYVNEDVVTAAGRDLFFGQDDHRRYYGRNLVTRIQAAGFEVYEDIANEPYVSRFSLLRGDTIFVARKRDPSALDAEPTIDFISSIYGALRKFESRDLKLEFS